MQDTRTEDSGRDQMSWRQGSAEDWELRWQEPACWGYHHDTQASLTWQTFWLDSLFEQLEHDELAVDGEGLPLALVLVGLVVCRTHLTWNEDLGTLDGTRRLSEAS